MRSPVDEKDHERGDGARARKKLDHLDLLSDGAPFLPGAM
jgi:hypothetical protein